MLTKEQLENLSRKPLYLKLIIEDTYPEEGGFVVRFIRKDGSSSACFGNSIMDAFESFLEKHSEGYCLKMLRTDWENALKEHSEKINDKGS